MRLLPVLRLPTLLAAAVVLLAVPPPGARAGSYVVRSCDTGSVSGWSAGRYAPVASSCRAGGGGALSAWVDGAPGEAAIWHFAAPADTEVAGFEITREYWLAATVPFGSPVYALQSFGPGRRYANIDANLSYETIRQGEAVERAAGLSGQHSIEISVNCGGGGACRRPAASLRLTAARIELRDAHDPRIESVAGSLAEDAPLTGVRALTYAASDRGGGVWRAELRLDGAVVAAGVADANGGACAPSAGAFTDVAPCKPTASGELAFDTRTLPDGRHALELRVYDATGSNRATWSRTIAVDNLPAPANRVRPAISGAAREGAELVAAPGEWGGGGLTFAYRWQRYEGSWEEIARATGQRYVASGQDAGRRLRVRVTATSPEGSAAAVSEPTDPVVAAAAPAPPPASAPSSGAGEQPAAAPSGLRVRAWLVIGRRRVTSALVRAGRAVALRGSVTDAAGRPAGGELVSVVARVGTGRPHPAAVARTAPDGRFAVSLPPGPSRRLRAVARDAAGPELRVDVRAPVSLQAVRHGRWVALTGELRAGPVPRGGVLVTVQGLRAHRWVALTTLRADRAGRFRGRVAAAAAPRLRAAVARQPGYPYARGVSPRRAPRTAARTSR